MSKQNIVLEPAPKSSSIDLGKQNAKIEKQNRWKTPVADETIIARNGHKQMNIRLSQYRQGTYIRARSLNNAN